jgi:hypothetical protein
LNLDELSYNSRQADKASTQKLEQLFGKKSDKAASAEEEKKAYETVDEEETTDTTDIE